jgi:hypothetical protein
MSTQDFIAGARLAAAGALIAVSAAGWQAAHAQAAAPAATETSAQAGVTIKVTPKRLDAKAWEFAVVLDTHSSALTDDLQNAAVLVVDGREIQPTQWQGAGPGGHHREGVLAFPGSSAKPGKYVLRIQRANESAARLFQWDGSAL